MCEQDGIWSGSRYFVYEKIRELYDEKRREPKEGLGRPAARFVETARKMIIASLELAEKVEAA